jgi:hypothetical protein
MATVIEVSYFNSFWLKQVSKTGAPEVATWPNGYPYNAVIPIEGVPAFPGDASVAAIDQWVIEESRIHGGYNNTQVDLGVKAYLVESNPNQQHRFNSLIYSGIFNSRTGVNNSNQFSVGEDITKSTDPANGSIQKLFAEDTNLIVLQENKVSRAPIDKNIIYSAEGGGTMTTSDAVIGTIQAYSGNYGISKNPESFATYGYQKYFTDKYRNVVLRLSQDGLTEISSYGMSNYFRDQLTALPDSGELIIDTIVSETNTVLTSILVTGETANIQIGMSVNVNNAVIPGVYVRNKSGNNIILSNPGCSVTLGDTISFTTLFSSKVIGGYDIHNKNYALSIQSSPTWIDSSDYYNTLSFDELVSGWISYFTYKPTFITSLKNKFYSFKHNNLYEHYSNGYYNTNAGTFYNIASPSTITFIFNQESSTSKVYQTVNYEGDSGWQVNSFNSDQRGQDINGTFGNWKMTKDSIALVRSYLGGSYDDYGSVYPAILIPPINYAGFVRNENKYYANLINNSQPTNGEIIWGDKISGIKGRYATVTISTDNITDVGGKKELWAVSSTYAG